MGAVRNHGNGPSDERFDANYFSIMVLLAYILNFINIWDGPFPTYGGILWFLERISLNVLILIFIIVLQLIQRNQFFFCECKRRFCRTSRITFYVKIALSYMTCTEHKLDRGLYLFSVIRTLIIFKEQMNRLSKGKDAHIRTYL